MPPAAAAFIRALSAGRAGRRDNSPTAKLPAAITGLRCLVLIGAWKRDTGMFGFVFLGSKGAKRQRVEGATKQLTPTLKWSVGVGDRVLP